MRPALLIYYAARWNASFHNFPFFWLFTNTREKMSVTRSVRAGTVQAQSHVQQ